MLATYLVTVAGAYFVGAGLPTVSEKPPELEPVPPEKYVGVADFEAYCLSALRGDSFSPLAGGPLCIVDGVPTAIELPEVCFWQYGSTLYEIDPQTQTILCDTSQRSQPPCNPSQRFCGDETEFCCPKE